MVLSIRYVWFFLIDRQCILSFIIYFKTQRKYYSSVHKKINLSITIPCWKYYTHIMTMLIYHLGSSCTPQVILSILSLMHNHMCYDDLNLINSCDGTVCYLLFFIYIYPKNENTEISKYFSWH